MWAKYFRLEGQSRKKNLEIAGSPQGTEQWRGLKKERMCSWMNKQFWKKNKKAEEKVEEGEKKQVNGYWTR